VYLSTAGDHAVLCSDNRHVRDDTGRNVVVMEVLVGMEVR